MLLALRLGAEQQEDEVRRRGGAGELDPFGANEKASLAKGASPILTLL
ncbi:MAG: hypothetical protein M3418_01100 [Gemmatimonadota bacterium]|nr:hypothetical protein [Gemmatimonadota bacterium]